MALESATYINQLVDTNPTGSDSISQGDDHIRLIKKVVQDSLPDVVGQAAATIITAGSAPTSNVRGTIWYDTGNDTLKINIATTGATASWVEIGTAAPWITSPASACIFHCTMASTQSLAKTTLTKLAFDTETFDVGSVFDTTTYQFTAPAAGKYYFNAAMRSSGTHTSDDDFYIYKNTGVYAGYHQYNSIASLTEYVTVSNTMNISCVMDMSASDTAEVRAYTEADAWTMGNTASATFFEGYRLV